MRLLLIVNESASSVTPRVRVLIGRALSAAHHLTVTETNRRGHATWLAQGAAADGVDAVVVLGGDGTVNEAANGLVGTSTAMAVLPGGSTNVYARTIGMVNNPVRATHQLLECLRPEAIRPVSLGVVNGRYFLFHVGFGFDGAVVAQVERRAGLKRHAGPLLFLWEAARTWAGRYDRSRPRLTIKTADGLAEDGLLAICLKTDPYTFFGNRPLTLAPGTGLDSALSVVNLRSLDLPVLLCTLGGALLGGPRGGREAPRRQESRNGGVDGRESRNGREGRVDGRESREGPTHRREGRADARTDRREGRSGVGYYRGLRALTVTGHGPLPYQVDGEYLGEALSFDLRCEPEALRLVLPVSGGPTT